MVIYTFSKIPLDSDYPLPMVFNGITETWTYKQILTFPIQVLKFSIAFLQIVNILWFSITSVEETSIIFLFDFSSTNCRTLSYDMHINLFCFILNLNPVQVFKQNLFTHGIT